MICCSGIARRIAASGFGVYAMDFEGFGLSEGLHGYVPSFDDLVDDVIEYSTKIKGMAFNICIPKVRTFVLSASAIEVALAHLIAIFF